MRTPSVLVGVANNKVIRLAFSLRATSTRKKDFMDETNGPEKITAEAKEGTEGMKEKASAAVDATSHAAEAAWSDAKNRANSLQSRCEAYVREKPIQALSVTLGVGILIGLLAPRK
jgi:ElaB/YqjD/DUF883 family membrane-anchored ribosome-binding protein